MVSKRYSYVQTLFGSDDVLVFDDYFNFVEVMNVHLSEMGFG